MSKHKRRLRPPSLYAPGASQIPRRKAPRWPRRWTQPAAFGVTLLLVIGLGVVHGALSDRWGTAPNISAVGQRLHAVPSALGVWHGTDREIDAQVLRESQFADYVYRNYTHASTHHEVAMLAVVGRPGPISIHTPDDCFAGAGYRQLKVNTKKRFRLAPADEAEFFAADFDGGPEVGPVRVYWSWNAGDGWAAPDAPRVTFAGNDALCKLYVLTSLAGSEKAIEASTADFIERLAPVLDQALFRKADR